MAVFAGSSYAAFALVWGLLCILSAVLVTDAMLRDARPAARADPEAESTQVKADERRARP